MYYEKNKREDLLILKKDEKIEIKDYFIPISQVSRLEK